MMGMFSLLHWLMMLVVFLLVAPSYIVPGIVATIYGHRHKVAIWVLNILVGWTVIGWVALLIWALMWRRFLPEQAEPAPPGGEIASANTGSDEIQTGGQ